MGLVVVLDRHRTVSNLSLGATNVGDTCNQDCRTRDGLLEPEKRLRAHVAGSRGPRSLIKRLIARQRTLAYLPNDEARTHIPDRRTCRSVGCHDCHLGLADLKVAE